MALLLRPHADFDPDLRGPQGGTLFSEGTGRKRKHSWILKLRRVPVCNMATEIVHQHSILDSLHPPTHSRLTRPFLFPAPIQYCCITFLYTRSFSYLSLPRLVKQTDRHQHQHYLIPRSPPQIFFKHTLASFTHDHSRYVVCGAA